MHELIRAPLGGDSGATLLRTLGQKLSAGRLSVLSCAPKRADPELLTAEHRRWRIAVIRSADYACQDCGARNCKLYADHIVERSDGGALLDPSNGRARCATCHGAKTASERGRRARESVGKGAGD